MAGDHLYQEMFDKAKNATETAVAETTDRRNDIQKELAYITEQIGYEREVILEAEFRISAYSDRLEVLREKLMNTLTELRGHRKQLFDNTEEN